MATPPLDVVVFLAANIPGLTAGTNLFHGLERPLPADAVFVTGASGSPPDRVMSLRYEIRYPVVHIRARARTQALAENWSRAIQNLFQTSLPNGYLDVRALQSEPTPSPEAQDQIKFTMSYQLVCERDAGP